jgi:hypothetical protein
MFLTNMAYVFADFFVSTSQPAILLQKSFPLLNGFVLTKASNILRNRTLKQIIKYKAEC